MFSLADFGGFAQINFVRCPGHTIQFLGYGYSKYIEKTLNLLGIKRDSLDWRKCARWTPFGDGEGWY